MIRPTLPLGQGSKRLVQSIKAVATLVKVHHRQRVHSRIYKDPGLRLPLPKPSPAKLPKQGPLLAAPTRSLSKSQADPRSHQKSQHARHYHHLRQLDLERRAAWTRAKESKRRIRPRHCHLKRPRSLLQELLLRPSRLLRESCSEQRRLLSVW